MKSGGGKKGGGGRRSSNKSRAQQQQAGAAGSAEHYQSIFSFTENELENVLQMFEAPVRGGDSTDADRGYGYLQDHQQRHPGYGMHHGHAAPHSAGMPATGAHQYGSPPMGYGHHGAPHAPHMAPNAMAGHQPPQQTHMPYLYANPMGAPGPGMTHDVAQAGPGASGQHPAGEGGGVLPMGAGAGVPGAAAANGHHLQQQPPPPAHATSPSHPNAGGPSAKSKSAGSQSAGGPGSKKGAGSMPQGIPQRFLPKKSSGSGGVYGSAGSNKGGSSVSHSVAEKQRRDRINTLIDELRELVPIDMESAENAQQPYGEDPSKRPKHVVLSDTIKFVRNVLAHQQRQQQQQQQQQAASANASASASDPAAMAAVKSEPRNSADSSGVSQGEQKPSQATLMALQQQPGQPQQMNNQPRRARESSASDSSHDGSLDSAGVDGIEIFVNKMEEDNDNKYAVNVNGRDRNGLLHDITSALRSMDLEIKTAVIKTDVSGLVSDSFEVDKSYCALSPKEIEQGLISRLSKEFEVKRKRTLDEGDKRKREV